VDSQAPIAKRHWQPISPDLFAVLFDGATALLPTDTWDALHTLRCSRALQHNELGEFESGTHGGAA